MNLEFHNYATVDKNGVSYQLQRADITRCPEFWRAWRSETTKAELKKLIYINNVDKHWYAYRQSPIGKDTGYEPFNFNYQLRFPEGLLPYQPCAVAHLVQSLIDNGAAADGSDTGIGKTYQALAVCRELSLEPVVVCRKAGVSSWLKACQAMKVRPRVIVNWEMMRTGKVTINGKHVLKRTKRSYRSGYDFEWRLPQGVLLIFDEAHLGFNPDSLNYAMWTASAGIASISASATFADRPSRLRGLFKVLRVMEEEEFDKWLVKRGNFLNQYNEYESLAALDDMKAINKILYPGYGYRVSYDDPGVKAYFPERVIQTEIVDLGEKSVEEQNRSYFDMIEKAKKLKELGKQAELMVADLRYRQYAELLKVPILVDMTREYLYEGKAVVVFVNFRETLAQLMKHLNTKNCIFGDQERFGIDREKVIEDFQSGRERIALCMALAGGQSLSLHDLQGNYQRISLICPTYDPVVLQQILGRTFRAGTKTTPIMKLVYAAKTVEEKVAETVNRKLANISALNNGDLMEPDLFSLGVTPHENG
jgi:superfamily II DNA or RNA helicase